MEHILIALEINILQKKFKNSDETKRSYFVKYRQVIQYCADTAVLDLLVLC